MTPNEKLEKEMDKVEKQIGDILTGAQPRPAVTLMSNPPLPEPKPAPVPPKPPEIALQDDPEAIEFTFTDWMSTLMDRLGEIEGKIDGVRVRVDKITARLK